MNLFKYSTEIIGGEWPKITRVTSPCPTLKVVGAVSKAMIDREELKRMQERPGFNADGTPIQLKLSKRQKMKLVVDKVTVGILRNTIGRVGRFVGKRVLGRVPEAALSGSYQVEKEIEQPQILHESRVEEEVIPSQTTLTHEQDDSLNEEIIPDENTNEVLVVHQAEEITSEITTLENHSQLFEEVIEEVEGIKASDIQTKGQ